MIGKVCQTLEVLKFYENHFSISLHIMDYFVLVYHIIAH